MDLRKRYGAYTTVEASFVMGVIILTISLILYCSLYFHDKNILLGAAYEAVQTAKERERMDEEEKAAAYFTERLEGKMLFFSGADCRISETSDEIAMNVSCSGKGMGMALTARAALTDPEEKIRKEGIGEEKNKESEENEE